MKKESLIGFCNFFCQTQPYPLHIYWDEKLIWEHPDKGIDLIRFQYNLFLAQKKNVFLHQTSEGLLLGGVFNHAHNILLLLGPAPITQLNEELIHNLMKAYDMKLNQKKALIEYLDQGLGHSLFHFRAILHQLYFFLNQEVEESVAEINLSNDSIRTEINIENIVATADYQDAESFRLAYHFEQNTLSNIRKGNIEAVRKIVNSSKMHIGRLSNSNLRQMKNLFICMTTLVTRAAIEGGLDLETAYQLSDSYINKMENILSVPAINEIIDTMYLDFTERTLNSKYASDIPVDLYHCLHYIRQNTHQPLKVQDVADYAHLSVSQLERKFNSTLGFYPSNFIMRCKLEEAKDLLAYTNKSMNEISQILAFSSQGYFCNVFKKEYGESPSSFRRKRQQV